MEGGVKLDFAKIESKANHQLKKHSLTPQKSVHSFRYFPSQMFYCCLLMHICIGIEMNLNAYTGVVHLKHSKA